MAKTFETPKGTRDFLPDEMRLRNAVFDRLRRAFWLFGYDELDTPAFEYLEVLTLKAGPSAEKEIYSFKDKGDRMLGLRFDLTSSTGRVAAAHPEIKRPIYRFQIGKVWRYDRPAAGRYREFYQADADIIGSYSMDCEVDLLLLATSVLAEFGLTEYRFVLNNRKILDAAVRLSEIPPEKKADAVRALDKLDKIGPDGVLKEAANYGIDQARFRGLMQFLGALGPPSGPHDPRATLDQVAGSIGTDLQGQAGVQELRHILDRAEQIGFLDRIHLDPTLARGLDYYTGPIFEARAVFAPDVEVGGGGLLSFAGGGRYDDLIGLYGGQQQGAVGFSFGVERLIDLLRDRAGALGGQRRPVLVAPIGQGRGGDAEQVAVALRRAGVPARLSLNATAPGKHLQYAEATGLEWIVFVGEQEAQEGRYPLKHLAQRTEERLSLAEIVARLTGL